MNLFTDACLSAPRVRAVQALLVYEDQALDSQSARYALTTHEIEHTQTGVQIGAGRLMGLHDQQALLDILLGTLATGRDFLPAEVICHSTACLAWFVRGRVRPMWFRLGHDSHRLTVPWPNLILHASGNRLRLVAYRGSGRPTPETPLYHAPLMNIYEHTSLCCGNAILPQGWSLAERPEYEQAVFSTNFTHVNHEQTLALPGCKAVKTAQHFRFWQELHQAKTARFPVRVLVPLEQTAAEWLSEER